MFKKIPDLIPMLFMGLIGLIFIAMIMGLLSFWMGRLAAVGLTVAILTGLAWYAYPRAQPELESEPEPDTPHLPNRVVFYAKVSTFTTTLYSGRYDSWQEGVPIEGIIAQAEADLARYPHGAEDRAEILNILAAAYNHLEEYEQALGYAQQALASFPAPSKRQRILNNLMGTCFYMDKHTLAVEYGLQAWALAEPVGADRLQNRTSAIVAFNLGMTYVEQEEVELAVSYLRLALTYFKPYLDPYYCWQISFTLGQLFYGQPSRAWRAESKSSDLSAGELWLVKSKDLDSLDAARQALELAHEALSHVHQQQIPIHLLFDFPQQRLDMYQLLVHVCLLELDEDAALAYAAASKGQRLVEALSRHLLWQELLAHDPQLQARWQPIAQLTQEIEQKQRDIQQVGQQDKQKWGEQQAVLKWKHQQQAELLQALHYDYPGLMATQNSPTLKAESARQLAQDLKATLVEFYQHVSDLKQGDGGYCAFVITPDLVRYVALPKLTDKFLAEMVAWVGRIETPPPTGQSESTYRSDATLYDLWDLYDFVLAPLEPFLPEPQQRLILAPYGKLHLLPLQAAFNAKTERYLIDEYELAFVPSLSALSVAWQIHQKKQRKPSIDSSLEIFNRRTPDGALLNFQRITLIQEFLPEEEATVQEVMRVVEQYTCVHIFCHAEFSPENGAASGLFLADRYLTVNDIMGLNLSQVRLMTLAACRMGRANIEVGDELTGLTNALLMAGAQAVVSGLWDVNVEATGRLFAHFYTLLNQGMPPTQALAEASRQVRAEKKAWSHPYYWAAFQVTGLGFEV